MVWELLLFLLWIASFYAFALAYRASWAGPRQCAAVGCE